jgi:hypothetical protein
LRKKGKRRGKENYSKRKEKREKREDSKLFTNFFLCL